MSVWRDADNLDVASSFGIRPEISSVIITFVHTVCAQTLAPNETLPSSRRRQARVHRDRHLRRLGPIRTPRPHSRIQIQGVQIGSHPEGRIPI